MEAHDTFGEPYGTTGMSQTVFGFTGEPTDANGLVQLRARYYNPTIGQFFNLDSFEGDMSQPMTLSRYGYVQGNVTNAIDPSGMIMESPAKWSGCNTFGVDPCSEYLYKDGRRYAECLKQNGLNPCPSGYEVGGNTTSEPYCVDSQGGDLAGAMWRRKWYLELPYGLDIPWAVINADAAEAGIDPSILVTTVTREWTHRWWKRNLDYGALWAAAELIRRKPSLGVAEVKVDTATDMICKYPGRFADIYGNVQSACGKSTSGDYPRDIEYNVVGWRLYTDPIFNGVRPF